MVSKRKSPTTKRKPVLKKANYHMTGGVLEEHMDDYLERKIQEARSSGFVGGVELGPEFKNFRFQGEPEFRRDEGNAEAIDKSIAKALAIFDKSPNEKHIYPKLFLMNNNGNLSADVYTLLKGGDKIYDEYSISDWTMLHIIKSLLNNRIKIYDENMIEIEDFKNLEPKRQYSSNSDEEIDHDSDEEMEELISSVKRSRLH